MIHHLTMLDRFIIQLQFKMEANSPINKIYTYNDLNVYTFTMLTSSHPPPKEKSEIQYQAFFLMCNKTQAYEGQSSLFWRLN